jgi:hypothetical protein
MEIKWNLKILKWKIFDEEMFVIFEEFKVVYKE